MFPQLSLNKEISATWRVKENDLNSSINDSLLESPRPSDQTETQLQQQPQQQQQEQLPKKPLKPSERQPLLNAVSLIDFDDLDNDLLALSDEDEESDQDDDTGVEVLNQ